MKEATIEQAFVTYCESLGYEALKLRIDGKNGWPDRTVFTQLGAIFFEFKTPSGRYRAMQKKRKLMLTELGYTVATPRRIGEAEAILDEFLKGSNRCFVNPQLATAALEGFKLMAHDGSVCIAEKPLRPHN